MKERDETANIPADCTNEVRAALRSTAAQAADAGRRGIPPGDRPQGGQGYQVHPGIHRRGQKKVFKIFLRYPLKTAFQLSLIHI